MGQAGGQIRSTDTLYNSISKIDCSFGSQDNTIRYTLDADTFAYTASTGTFPSGFLVAFVITTISIVDIAIITLSLKPNSISTDLLTDCYVLVIEC